MAKNYLTVSSFSDPGKNYVITRRKDGTLDCTCMSYAFSKEDPKVCKHVLSYGHRLEPARSVLTITVEMDNDVLRGYGTLDAMLANVASAVATGHTAGALRNREGNTVCRYEVR